MASDEQVAVLRPMINEPDETTYSDDVLKTMIDQAEDNLDLTAATIWEQKMARFSTLTDTSESGSSRSASQLYKQALQQTQYYANKARVDEVVVVDTTQRARTRTAVRK